jgi:hypothetical protein
MRILRLYADEGGESHFETQDIPIAARDFAPPTAPFHVSPEQAAAHYVIIQLPVGWGGDRPHPTPGRHMLFCLSGSIRVQASDGDARSIGAGDALRMEDISGKGHKTTVTSDIPVTAVMVRLA